MNLLAAMSFGQALTLPSFSALVGQDCHSLRSGDSHIGVAVAVGTYIGVVAGTYVYLSLLAAMSFGQALTLPSFSALVGEDCHLLWQGAHTVSESSTIEAPLNMN